MNNSITKLVGYFLVAASIFYVAKIGSDTVLSLKLKGDLTVKGLAKQSITSDLCTFDITIFAEGPELQACYTALADSKNKVVQYLATHEVSAAEYRFEPAYVEEKHKIHPRGHELNMIEKYVLSQPITIESKDVAKIQKISADIVELMNEGVRLNIGRPQYFYTPLDSMKADMIGLATENARLRATTIAKKGGFELGPIREVRVGVFQITPLNSTDVSDSGINDNSSINKDIKSVVEISYFIK